MGRWWGGGGGEEEAGHGHVDTKTAGWRETNGGGREREEKEMGEEGGGEWWTKRFVCWLLACLTSQQHTSVSQGRICSDSFTCCHIEIEVADQTFHLTKSQYTGPTSPSTDPITPGAWQAGFEPHIFRSRGGRLNH